MDRYSILKKVAVKYSKDILIVDDAINCAAGRFTNYFYCLVCQEYVRIQRHRREHFNQKHKNIPHDDKMLLDELAIGLVVPYPVYFDLRDVPRPQTEAERKIHKWYLDKLWASQHVVRNRHLVEDTDPKTSTRKRSLEASSPVQEPVEKQPRKELFEELEEENLPPRIINVLKNIQEITMQAKKTDASHFDLRFSIVRDKWDADDNGLPYAFTIGFATCVLKDSNSTVAAKKDARSIKENSVSRKNAIAAFHSRFKIPVKSVYTFEDFREVAKKSGCHVALFWREVDERHYEVVYEANVGACQKLYMAVNHSGIFHAFNPVQKFVQGTLCQNCVTVHKIPSAHTCDPARVDRQLDVAILTKLTTRRKMPKPIVSQDIKPCIRSPNQSDDSFDCSIDSNENDDTLGTIASSDTTLNSEMPLDQDFPDTPPPAVQEPSTSRTDEPTGAMDQSIQSIETELKDEKERKRREEEHRLETELAAEHERIEQELEQKRIEEQNEEERKILERQQKQEEERTRKEEEQRLEMELAAKQQRIQQELEQKRIEDEMKEEERVQLQRRMEEERLRKQKEADNLRVLERERLAEEKKRLKNAIEKEKQESEKRQRQALKELNRSAEISKQNEQEDRKQRGRRKNEKSEQEEVIQPSNRRSGLRPRGQKKTYVDTMIGYLKL